MSTNAEIMSVPCPTCHAPAHRPCVGIESGKESWTGHVARREAYDTSETEALEAVQRRQAMLAQRWQPGFADGDRVLFETAPGVIRPPATMEAIILTTPDAQEDTFRVRQCTTREDESPSSMNLTDWRVKQVWPKPVGDPAVRDAFPGSPKSTLAQDPQFVSGLDFSGIVKAFPNGFMDDGFAGDPAMEFTPQEPEHLYEKCSDCHLFVEPNSAVHGPTGFDGTLALYDHLHRGDRADEALDSTHEARPSGMKANLATWKAYGPQDMRIRFDYQPK